MTYTSDGTVGGGQVRVDVAIPSKLLELTVSLELSALCLGALILVQIILLVVGVVGSGDRL